MKTCGKNQGRKKILKEKGRKKCFVTYKKKRGGSRETQRYMGGKKMGDESSSLS
jgi:hypothetical protein